MKALLIAGLFATASAAAFAEPMTYTVDPSHTYASFEVNHLGFSIQSGTFTSVNGHITLDKIAHTGQVDVTIDTNSLQTFWPARDKHLKGADFFNVAKYPTMTYKATKLVFSGDKLSQVQGDLTLLGVTKPVTLSVEHFHCGKHPMSGKEACGANVTARIKRTEFDMKKFVPAVSDEVDLKLVVEAMVQ